MKTKNETTETQFNHAGFVVSNPIKGRVYLCWNNCITDPICCGCGNRHTAGWPLWFFFEGDAGAPVCEQCAFKEGFTMSPDSFRRMTEFVGLGICNQPSEAELAATPREETPF